MRKWIVPVLSHGFWWILVLGEGITSVFVYTKTVTCFQLSHISPSMKGLVGPRLRWEHPTNCSRFKTMVSWDDPQNQEGQNWQSPYVHHLAISQMVQDMESLKPNQLPEWTLSRGLCKNQRAIWRLTQLWNSTGAPGFPGSNPVLSDLHPRWT